MKRKNNGACVKKFSVGRYLASISAVLLIIVFVDYTERKEKCRNIIDWIYLELPT